MESSDSKIVMERLDEEKEGDESRRRASMQPPGPAPMIAILVSFFAGDGFAIVGFFSVMMR